MGRVGGKLSTRVGGDNPPSRGRNPGDFGSKNPLILESKFPLSLCNFYNSLVDRAREP
jgi:hypothetical protein